ncbi:hypothetical protein [Streptomyces subrutilus]|uniref:hypothetical protein n=1 Tax=Streptomyces subrutilus TaxID=36818 RepID=UPI001E2F677D|nr:hypothetical protein [Streptomyces subrutilus]
MRGPAEDQPGAGWSTGHGHGHDRGHGYDHGYDHGPYAAPSPPAQPPIYLSLVTRWREAGRTLPGHPDEEWERLISQPCWPGR